TDAEQKYYDIVRHLEYRTTCFCCESRLRNRLCFSEFRITSLELWPS
ncbi:hypothetical protein AVEN_95061-1, partial [Araneus ventricosus]